MKGDMSSVFSLKCKMRETEAEHLGSDKVECRDQGHDEVEKDEKKQQKSATHNMEGKGDQGREGVEGEEEMIEVDHQTDEVQEGKRKGPDNVQSLDSEKEISV